MSTMFDKKALLTEATVLVIILFADRANHESRVMHLGIAALLGAICA